MSALVATQRFWKPGLKVLKIVILAYSSRLKKMKWELSKLATINDFYPLIGIQICFF